jgi:hypothetical protein
MWPSLLEDAHQRDANEGRLRASQKTRARAKIEKDFAGDPRDLRVADDALSGHGELRSAALTP